MEDLQALVDAADEAALLRAVDGRCASRQWDVLVDLARRCREAVELGKQLWPVAEHIEYRLALEAPAPYAAAVLRPGAGRFTFGPLTEVAANQHAWAALAPHIPDPASRIAVAQERVLRGEDLTGCDVPAELPLRLADFEPAYALPRYRDREARFDAPEVVGRHLPPPRRMPDAAAGPEDAGARALRDVVEQWVAQSSGVVRTACVEGDVAAAVGALTSEAALVEITAGEALAWLQWAGASGGAHGRRRGGASGRFSAWWAVACLAGLSWPDTPDGAFEADVAAALVELRWYRWAPPGPQAGWALRVAVEDPVDRLAWAVDASDHRDDEDDATS